MTVDVQIVREATHKIVDAFDRLLPQLSSTAAPLNQEAADGLVKSEASTLLVASLLEGGQGAVASVAGVTGRARPAGSLVGRGSEANPAAEGVPTPGPTVALADKVYSSRAIREHLRKRTV
ncbi:hypothetical protein [Streptomyces decoyicus]|uniref:hypothetical protein n=1 Tax=Streptomyces decoyicus TaxID=249567 RepID=UPI00386C99BE